MLQQLKNINLDRMAMDEALSVYAFGVQLQTQYDAFQVETPQWLTDNMSALKREIQDRMRDELLRQIRLDEASLETLKSRDEKRQDAQTRLEARKARLAAMATAVGKDSGIPVLPSNKGVAIPDGVE